MHVAKHTGTLRLALRLDARPRLALAMIAAVMPCESLRTLLAGLLLPG